MKSSKNNERKKAMMGLKQLEPKILYSVNIYDLVPEDNFYRRLSEFLDLKFVYQECKTVYGKTGNPSIDPVVFFRLVLFGYFENIISDRELIRRASDSLGVRLYLGYDLDEEMPWHSTISRTRARIPEKVFEKLFDKILRMCIDKGLVSGEHQSIDSTLVKANASLESLEKKVPKLELSKYIKETREENPVEEIPEEKRKTIESKEVPNQILQTDKQESKMEIVPTEKPNVKRQSLKSRSNKEYVSKSDPDSRIARKPGKLTDLYYMTHYSVDSKFNIITDVHTKHADQSDSDTLIEVVERAQGRLAKEGLEIKSVSADKNYCSGKNLRTLEGKGIEPFIPTQKHPNTTGTIAKSEFIYDRQKDAYICPSGNILEYRYTTKRQAKVYAAEKKECKNCPLRNKCTSGKKQRLVQHSIYIDEYERLDSRIKSYNGKKKRRIRQITTEPLFAEAKENHGLSKFMTRGIQKAKKNSMLIASVQNLKRLINFGKKKLQVDMKKVKSCLAQQVGTQIRYESWLPTETASYLS
jgi:transposase